MILNVCIWNNLCFPFILERIPKSNQCYSSSLIMLKVELVILPKNLVLMQWKLHCNLGQGGQINSGNRSLLWRFLYLRRSKDLWRIQSEAPWFYYFSTEIFWIHYKENTKNEIFHGTIGWSKIILQIHFKAFFLEKPNPYFIFNWFTE